MKFTGNLEKQTQQDILFLLILWVLHLKGGTALRQDVLNEMEPILRNALEEEDCKPEIDSSSGILRGRQTWYHAVDAKIKLLRDNGYLLPVEQRGDWVLSDKGRKRVETLNAGIVDRDSGITLDELKGNLNFPDDDGNIPTLPIQTTASVAEPQSAPAVAPLQPEPEIADPPASNLLLPYFEKKGYKFSQFQIATFYAALKTKGFVILSGLSGTGKTKLAQHFGELFGEDCVWFESVRPDWRDSKNLLGFVNPLLDNKYQSTGLLRFLQHARDNTLSAEATQVAPHFLILDEMNLAHVEYYFAEFLSVLESGRITQTDVAKREENLASDFRVGFTREAIHLHSCDAPIQDTNSTSPIPSALRLPPNLYIIGTVNIDETTFAFSPKVLDRAFTIEFRDADLENYNPMLADSTEANEIIEKIRANVFADFTRESRFIANDKEDVALALDELGEYRDALIELNKLLEPYDLHFGYRVLDEIALFFANARVAQSSGIVLFDSDDEILDAAVLMKVLPKIHGSRQKLQEPLERILRWTLEKKNGDDVFKLIGGEGTQKSEIPALLERWDTLADKFAYPATAKKVLRMLHALYTTGFASFS
jgi:hypothetical protein